MASVEAATRINWLMTLPPDSTPPLPAAPARSRRVLLETRSLWNLTWPILIGQLATVGMSVTNVAMAGHYAAADLAGVSLGVSIWNMTILTLMGLLMSVNPIVAHHVGAGEFDTVPHVVRQGLWKAVGVGVLAFVLANLAAQVFDLMNIEPAVCDVAKHFVHVSSFSLPAFTCYRVLYGYSTSINQTKPMMVIALIALLLNALVNWLLVFGNWGFAELGGVGCAWSTMVCVWFHPLALLWWMRQSPAYRRTWPFSHWEWPQWPMLRSLLKLGVPIGITYFAETSAFSLIALLIAKFGSAQVGAHAIALNFTSLTFMVPLSLGLALLTRVGQSLGANDPVAARFRAWVGVGLTLAFAVVSAAGMALFRHEIASAYTSDTVVAALAAHLLVFAALFQLSDCSQVVTSCAIRGYKVTRAPMVLHLAAFWGFSLPLGCLLGLAPQWLPFAPAEPMAAQGFWIALIVGLTVAASGLILMLRNVARKRILLA
jgi:MATE family multidrug resistance protein